MIREIRNYVNIVDQSSLTPEEQHRLDENYIDGSELVDVKSITTKTLPHSDLVNLRYIDGKTPRELLDDILSEDETGFTQDLIDSYTYSRRKAITFTGPYLEENDLGKLIHVVHCIENGKSLQYYNFSNAVREAIKEKHNSKNKSSATPYVYTIAFEDDDE